METTKLLAQWHGLTGSVSATLPSKTVPVAIIILSYLLLVRTLRYRKMRMVAKKYAYLAADPYAVPYRTAHEIMKVNTLNEMPFINGLAGQVGLLETYGIASGTKLLVATRQLTSKEKVGKRVEDTGVALVEVLAGDMDSERALRALSKVNWLHSRYKKVISNEEMLHTLYNFLGYALLFIERYEWRSLTEVEKVARYVFWKEVGLRMGIRDIPPTLEAFDQWNETYQVHAMVYADSNRTCMDTTVDVTLRALPPWSHNFVKNAIATFMSERALIAVGWPKPPTWVSTFIVGFMRTRAFMTRHFFLPRFKDLDILPKMEADGRLYRQGYLAEPWYIKDTFWNRWSVWFGSKGRMTTGQQFKSHGYLPEELGPLEFEEQSRQPVRQAAAAMRTYVDHRSLTDESKIAGCPFAYGDALAWT